MKFELEDVAQIIIALTALAGLISTGVLSVLNYRRQERIDKILIRVELGVHILMTPRLGSTKPEFSENMYTTKIINYGKREYEVASLGFEIGRHSGGIYINDPIGTAKLPYVLKPDATCNFWKSKKELDESFKKPFKHRRSVKVRAYVNDYMGNTYYSNWYRVKFTDSKSDLVFEKIKKFYTSAIKIIWP